MITIKVARNKFFTEYLKWLDPLLNLSKGERDIFAALLTLHYAHKHYAPDVLDELLFSDKTAEMIRKKLKINKRLYDKLFKSLEQKGLVQNKTIRKQFLNYPKDDNFKIFVNFEIEK